LGGLALALAGAYDHALRAAQAPIPASSALMTLDVAATDAPMKILHATMSMPAKPCPMTLFYLLHARHLEFIGLIAPVGLAKPEEAPRDALPSGFRPINKFDVEDGQKNSVSL
jgi:hypothetical protein